ncbi:hypothetical protein WL482_04280 [Staphylococcus hominis]|uniref:hypothetical protein n=1 Tax=Staphylococcus hominis TaxID=1290 RepID=UPI00287A0F9C|nr:hypothetical protein [Staphylococcus hominis]MDS3888918.1 hypothetical protein [Staphylococcus hominis]
MKEWEKFERETYLWVKNNYNLNENEIILEGGSNSNRSDLRIDYKGNQFYIEIKHSPSQASQFVALYCDNKYIYSPGNKTKLETNINLKQVAEQILKSLNQLNKKVIDTETIIINNPEKWVIDYYLNKKVKYIITNYNKETIVFPIERINDYFNIKIVARYKKSGSRAIPKKDYERVKKFINNKFDGTSIFDTNDGFIFKNSNLNNIITNKRNNGIYEISEKNENNYRMKINRIEECRDKYEVKKLSDTNNLTIVFNLETKSPQKPNDLKKFNDEFK